MRKTYLRISLKDLSFDELDTRLESRLLIFNDVKCDCFLLRKKNRVCLFFENTKKS